MFKVYSMRFATIAVLLVLWGNAWAEQDLKAGAAAMLEVRVLDVQASPGPDDRNAVIYQMEVISVLRSTFKVKPGETIVVRADAVSAQDGAPQAPARLAPGWLGVAYLNPDPDPDPEASGRTARQFTIAASRDSFEEIPPGPPALQWTQPVESRVR